MTDTDIKQSLYNSIVSILLYSNNKYIIVLALKLGIIILDFKGL